MRKRSRIWICLALALLVISLLILAMHIQMKHSLNGTLYVCRGNQEWLMYDWDAQALCAIPNVDSSDIYSMQAAGNGNVWVLKKSDTDTWTIALWNQTESVYEESISFQPLAVSVYQNGLLLMRPKANDQIMQYRQQGAVLKANSAEILYMDQTGKEDVLAECGYNTADPQAFFVSQGDAFTFLKPDFYIEKESLVMRCSTDTLCIYENGSVREMPIQDAKVDSLRSGGKSVLALKESDLYSFSLQSGLGRRIQKGIGMQNGAGSPDGRYYLYTRLHGLFGDRWDAYVLDMDKGIKIRLKGVHNVGTEGFSFCWA